MICMYVLGTENFELQKTYEIITIYLALIIWFIKPLIIISFSKRKQYQYQ